MLWKCPMVNAIRAHWLEVNIASGNGWVSSGNNPLPERVFTKISDAIEHHYAATPYTVSWTTWLPFCRRHLQMHFLNEKFYMLVQTSLKFVPKADGPLDNKSPLTQLTHWGRVTHIRVGKLTSIGSDNGLSPGRSQAIIWTNAGILLIGPLGTNFSEILSKIHTFSFKKMHLKTSSAKWRPFCLGLNVLMAWHRTGTTTGWHNSLSPVWRQAIIWTSGRT